MDLVLAESAGVADALEELPAGGVLHDDGEVRRGEDDLLEADDVGVAQRAVVDDLALHVLVNLQGKQEKKPLKRGADRAKAGEQQSSKRRQQQAHLLAALDVLDGDELAVGAVAHEARDAEVAGADVADELVAVAVVHYGHVHPGPHGHRRPVHPRLASLPPRAPPPLASPYPAGAAQTQRPEVARSVLPPAPAAQHPAAARVP